MKYTEYKSPGDFLQICRPVFESNESLYGLMLSLSIRLERNPLYYGSQPLMATIQSGSQMDLIALMTPPFKLQIAMLNTESSEPIEFLAKNLLEKGWSVPAVMAEEQVAREFGKIWNRIADTTSRDGMRQGIYELREVEFPEFPAGSFRVANESDFELAARWGKAFFIDCFGEKEPLEDMERITRDLIIEGNLYFWVAPEPVSMAALTRSTVHGIFVSYVYTPSELRRRGYASAIVARISQLALDRGHEFCTLYTDLDNPTSNSIYQKVGYRHVAEIMDLHFEEC